MNTAGVDRVQETREAVRISMAVKHKIGCASFKRVRGRGSIDGTGTIYVKSGNPCSCGAVTADAILDEHESAIRDELLNAVESDVTGKRTTSATGLAARGYNMAIDDVLAAIRARRGAGT